MTPAELAFAMERGATQLEDRFCGTKTCMGRLDRVAVAPTLPALGLALLTQGRVTL